MTKLERVRASPYLTRSSPASQLQSGLENFSPFLYPTPYIYKQPRTSRYDRSKKQQAAPAHVKMKLHAAVAASLLALAAAASAAGAVTFDATNTASGTPGGRRFDQAVGLGYAKRVLSDASAFIWRTFDQRSAAARKPVAAVTLVVEDIGGVAFTSGDAIHLSARYVGGYPSGGDVRAEVTGVLYHEATHVWQWDGRGAANGGLVEGIADYVRLKAGYAPAHWVKPGQGDRWDQGYDVTARFLDYCASLKPGFVAQLNAKMKDGYSDDFFAQITGKSVQQLWQDYKKKYGG
ncbi:uncharacterized protein LOC120650675 [Panicum virgatum]|uniref:Uncharacterized protein n=1 Tax=Panicum virgatum TaxID=38727 RepID=A0A8T0NN00_PANVG|nr:uncharacterized protein LOC120650675 [Panicum virgatum]KAG2548224.1 hypothetical protein PVAP13_9KG154585 [Panicum virgatum]